MATDIELALDPDKEYEIVGGAPEEKVMGGVMHGVVGARLTARLLTHVENHGLGMVCGPDTSFAIGANERLPDIAFVAAARMPTDILQGGVCSVAPDLAVEVVSPHDLYQRVFEKLGEYLRAGVREVWLVDPRQQTVAVHRSRTECVVFEAGDQLTSETLLPGFRCLVGELFRPPVPPPKPPVNG